MANYPRWMASITLMDNAERKSVVEFYVPEATAKLYFAAADKTARDTTALGVLFSDIQACTEMNLVQQMVSVVDELAPVTIPASGVVRGNKVVLAGQTGPNPFLVTIPGRDSTAYTLKTNSIEIDIEADGALKTLIQQIQTICVGIHGESVDIQKAYLND